MDSRNEKVTKEYIIENNVITVESTYSDERNINDLLKEHLQTKIIKAVASSCK